MTNAFLELDNTVYVNVKGLTMFAITILPNITTPIVLLLGQYHLVIQIIPEKTKLTLLSASACIVRVFTCNVGHHYHQPYHPKLVRLWHYCLSPGAWSLQIFIKAFWRQQHNNPNTFN
jgi:hypothetical protein